MPDQAFENALAEWKANNKRAKSAGSYYRNATVVFLEWSGTRNRPKAKEITLQNCLLEVPVLQFGEAKFITIVDEGGCVLRKKNTTRGFAWKCESKPISSRLFAKLKLERVTASLVRVNQAKEEAEKKIETHRLELAARESDVRLGKHYHSMFLLTNEGKASLTQKECDQKGGTGKHPDGTFESHLRHLLRTAAWAKQQGFSPPSTVGESQPGGA